MATGRALCFPGNMLGRRWYIELATAGAGRFGGALAYVTACRTRAAITTVPDWATDVARLGAPIDSRGSLADLDDSGALPRWLGSRPLVFNFREAAHAARDTPMTPCARGSRMCSSPPGHKLAKRILEEASTPNVLGEVMVRRPRRLCPAIGEEQVAAALAHKRPTPLIVGQYACHVFLRFPLNEWPEGARGSLFGCAGSPDVLYHYIVCARLWTPIHRAVRMSASPSLAQHAALDGDALRRVAAVRAWVAAVRAYMMVRRDGRVALCGGRSGGRPCARLASLRMRGRRGRRRRGRVRSRAHA